MARRFEDLLPEPADIPHVLVFTGTQMQAVRTFARGVAAGYGLAADRTTDLVLAVNEIATNSIRYGGGAGVLHRPPRERRAPCAEAPTGSAGAAPQTDTVTVTSSTSPDSSR